MPRKRPQEPASRSLGHVGDEKERSVEMQWPVTSFAINTFREHEVPYNTVRYVLNVRSLDYNLKGTSGILVAFGFS